MGLLNFLFRCCLLILNRNKTSDAGHNLVADGWTGAFNPHPHPNSQPNRQTNAKYITNARFSTFRLMVTDQWTNEPTDRPMDGWMDKASYRVAFLQLKTVTDRERDSLLM